MNKYILSIVLILFGFYIIYQTLKNMGSGEVRLLSPYARRLYSYKKEPLTTSLIFFIQVIAGAFCLFAAIYFILS